MTRPQYATYPTGSSYCNAFPCCTSYAGPTDYYRNASQALSKQHQQCSLPMPSLSQPASFADVYHFASADILSALELDRQCIISDLAATKTGLTSTEVCSRQAVKKISAQLLPVRGKPPKGDATNPELSRALSWDTAFASMPMTCLNASYSELAIPIWPKPPPQVSQE